MNLFYSLMNATRVICPLCNDAVDKLLYRFHIESERKVIGLIKEQNPEWTETDGICSRCVDYYHTEVVMQQRVLPEIGPHFPVKNVDDFIILPTGLRLDADPQFTGKGVTICFIDSGFSPHPDLVACKNRIKRIADLSSGKAVVQSFTSDVPVTDNSAWHGSMTAVVCAGDGYLSNGLYKGIASDAELVLLKVQNQEGRITTEAISKAMKWVLRNHRKYGIRIVNMSLGDDEAVAWQQSEIDQLAEQLIDAGIMVVAAVGNDVNGKIKPPANSPRVIAVGGIDDQNNLDKNSAQLYHSAYGQTTDGLMKPELLAPAIWIAAPILPGTGSEKEAGILYQLLQCSDEQLKDQLQENHTHTGLDESVLKYDNPAFIRKAIVQRVQTCKFISPFYMHVDGTSFAAPIVSSVIAQMLEANPQLTPASIREILFSTAKRIEGLPAVRQGFGQVRPRKSVFTILKKEVIMKTHTSPYINRRKKSIEFYVQHDCASQISLAGSFNHWAQDVLLMQPGKNGVWKIEIPMLSAGKYTYKFFVDDRMWLEDVDNPYREPDGFSGFNSILVIEN